MGGKLCPKIILEGTRLTFKTEIAFELMGFNRGMAASNIATSNPEMLKLHKQFLTDMSDYCLMVVIGGYSSNDKALPPRRDRRARRRARRQTPPLAF